MEFVSFSTCYFDQVVILAEPLNDVHFTYIYCNFAFFRLPTDNLKLTPEQLSVVNYDVDNGVIKIMAFAGNFKTFVIFVCVYV